MLVSIDLISTLSRIFSVCITIRKRYIIFSLILLYQRRTRCCIFILVPRYYSDVLQLLTRRSVVSWQQDSHCTYAYGLLTDTLFSWLLNFSSSVSVCKCNFHILEILITVFEKCLGWNSITQGRECP